MLKTIVGGLAAAALVAGAASAATSPVLAVEVDESVFIVDDAAFTINDPLFFLFDVAGSGAATFGGFSTSSTVLEVFASGDLASGPFSFFDVSVLTPAFETVIDFDTLLDFGADSDAADDDDDVIELLFAPGAGLAADAFTFGALVTFTGEFGDDPFVSGFSDQFTTLRIEAVAGEIPVPGAFALMIAGLGALAATRPLKSPDLIRQSKSYPA